jgi:hypothetical protein
VITKRGFGVWLRGATIGIGIGTVLVVVLVGLTLLTGAGSTHLGVSPGDRSTVVAQDDPGTTALRRWWADSRDDVEALSGAISDVQQSLARRDADAVGAACLRMHDAAALKVKAHLPAPDADLTSDLSGAVDDAHAAAHMCLAAEAGSQNNYSGEFRSDLEQAGRQLRAAQALINKLLASDR